MSRRAVLAGAAAVGTVTALAACGSASSNDGAATPTGPVTVKAGDVPVGGGKIIGDARVVVTQPTAGAYKAFSAVCTHQGCLVAQVQNDRILCACHNSEFSAVDGSVKMGPATAPLASRTVAVNGSTLTLS